MPQNYWMGTTINDQPNYNVELDADPALADQATQFAANLPWGAGTAQFTPADVHTQQVDPNQLLSHQLTGLLDQDNPYIQNARQRAREAAGARGMGNSSIAMGAAERSAIEAGLPIAQFDAGRYGHVADLNMGAQNQAELANMQGRTQVGLENARARGGFSGLLLGHQLGALDDYRRHMLGIETREDQQAFGAGQANIDRELDERRFWEHGAPLDWSTHQLDAWGLANQSFLNPIMSIYSNPNLTAEQQNQAVQNWIDMAGPLSEGAQGMMPPWMQGPPPSFGTGRGWEAASRLPPVRIGRGG